jgi:ribosomal protein S18 acetylase RimI-like enzyme
MTGRERSAAVLRAGTDSDLEACVSLWVDACARRDGARVAGVAERARPKFSRREAWVVAERSGQVEPVDQVEHRITGFVLATEPGSGQASDPPGAVVVGLLAVDPSEQGRGVGSLLLSAVTTSLSARGHGQAVLHVLTSNLAAVHLYESQGWRPAGKTFEHTLLKKPFQTYVIDLRA